jgi:hypothetical protein
MVPADGEIYGVLTRLPRSLMEPFSERGRENTTGICGCAHQRYVRDHWKEGEGIPNLVVDPK